MGKIFSFFNQKGGVGKTTSVINIATVIAGFSKKVLLFLGTKTHVAAPVFSSSKKPAIFLKESFAG